MKPNASGWIVGGAVSIAAAMGITTAMMQRSQSPPSPPAALSTLPAIPSTSPEATPSPQSTAPPQADTRSTSPTQAQSSRSPDASSSETRTVEVCETNMAIVADPEPPLNVRSAPSAETGQVVGHLQNGTMVMIEAEQNGWYKISSPRTGWIAKQRTESRCNQKVERIQFESQSQSSLIQDRFIGTGSHSYKFQADKGQVMTITRFSGPFPSVAAPDGTFLRPLSDDNQPNWSQTLPQTGAYSIQLDSNYKGYLYRFRVEIR
ncbi:MAG TPA: SH3 domain-containing protein [Coleofasciculaceae cyanobacterium]